MAKVVYKGQKTRMVFGISVRDGHVLNISDSLARTLDGDVDFSITYSSPQPSILIEEEPKTTQTRKKRGKKK